MSAPKYPHVIISTRHTDRKPLALFNAARDAARAAPMEADDIHAIEAYHIDTFEKLVDDLRAYMVVLDPVPE